MHLRNLISSLKKKSHVEKVGIWKRIATDLEKPTRQRRIVNLSILDRYTKENETVIVPGKVLGMGSLNHKLTIAAFSFSGGALQKIEESKGVPLSIDELVQKNPKGKNVRIMG